MAPASRWFLALVVVGMAACSGEPRTEPKLEPIPPTPAGYIDVETTHEKMWDDYRPNDDIYIDTETNRVILRRKAPSPSKP